MYGHGENDPGAITFSRVDLQGTIDQVSTFSHTHDSQAAALAIMGINRANIEADTIILDLEYEPIVFAM
jgi:hypothetical protein